jgi:hypothetical protein
MVESEKRALKDQIRSRRFEQDKTFYDEILNINDRLKSDRALSDLLNSSRIPVVRKLSRSLSRTGIDNCVFPPLQPYDDSQSRVSASGSRQPGNTANSSVDSSTVYADAIGREKEQAKRISLAFQHVERARSSRDPAACYYDAALVFNELQM